MTQRFVRLFGPYRHNKGDWLMTYAIAHQLSGQFGVAYDWRPSAEGFTRHDNLYQLVPDSPRNARTIRGAIKSFLAGPYLLSESILRYVRIGRTSALLDASGFRYGDQWPDVDWSLTKQLNDLRAGEPLIFLPQTFGPFERKDNRDGVKRLFSKARIVFARDQHSLQHLRSLDLDTEIAQVPDMSHLVTNLPQPRNDWSRTVAIIPNMRMIDRTSAEVGDHYPHFLRRVIQWSRERGFDVALVVHEMHDRALAVEMARDEVPVVDVGPLETKAILGHCRAVIGSRYHSLIAALSQGTPVLGTGWAHKYDALFADYGASHCLLNSLDRDETESMLDYILDDQRREDLSPLLEARAAMMRQQVEAMWVRVEREIEASG